MEDRADTSSTFDNMEVAIAVACMHSSSSSSCEFSRNDATGDPNCGSIRQTVHMKRRRAEHVPDVIDTDESFVDDLAATAAQGDDVATYTTLNSAHAFADPSVERNDGGSSAIVSSPGNIGDLVPFTSGIMSTNERRRTNRPSFSTASSANAAATVVLFFILICATSAATAAANEAVMAGGADVPTLDGRFQRRHVTTTAARTNLRRSSASSTYSKAVENSVGRRMADFFTDHKAEPLEFRTENVNTLRPTQSQEESEMATLGNAQKYLPPLSPTSEKRATIVFHQPAVDPGMNNKAAYIPIQPVQTVSTFNQQKQSQQPHGGGPLARRCQLWASNSIHLGRRNDSSSKAFISLATDRTDIFPWKRARVPADCNL